MGTPQLEQYNASLLYCTIINNGVEVHPENRQPMEFRRMTRFLQFEYRMLVVYIETTRPRRRYSNNETWRVFINKLALYANVMYFKLCPLNIITYRKLPVRVTRDVLV